jgi:hypothetical protein
MLDSKERGILELFESIFVDSDFYTSSLGDFIGFSSSNIRESLSELDE